MNDKTSDSDAAPAVPDAPSGVLDDTIPTHSADGRELSPAARRALAEAAERRAVQARADAAAESEKGGPKGPEPTRYGDWERKGIAVDF